MEKLQPVVADNATQYLTKVAISIPTVLLAQIDKKRQDVTRSRFIVRILEQHLGGGKN